MACCVNFSIFPSQILLVLEIVIGVQFYGHAGDNFLQESPIDEDMEDNDEGDHDWSEGSKMVSRELSFQCSLMLSAFLSLLHSIHC